MVTHLRVLRNRPFLAAVATSLLGLCLPAPSAWGDSLAYGPAHEIGSKLAETPSKRPRRTKGPTSKPDGAGNFVYGIINQIRAQSEELCARYGNSGDCLEEAEVCLTMRDGGDNQVRLCLNTAPGEGEADSGKVQKSRLRR